MLTRIEGVLTTLLSEINPELPEDGRRRQVALIYNLSFVRDNASINESRVP